MRIAIASTGLGHVARGIESWAISLARGLTGHAAASAADRDIETTLFAARKREPAPALPSSAMPPPSAPSSPIFNLQPSTFNPPSSPCSFPIPCLKRGDRAVRLLARLAPGWTWRWGWTSPYAFEQRSFARGLIRRLRVDPHDIVHTQDVVLAHRLVRAVRRGTIRSRIILAHGTDEDAATLADLPVIQHLATPHREALAPALKHAAHYVIPNFVDAYAFSPPSPDRRQTLRRDLGIPETALVIGYSGALKREHKRLDALIDAVARAAASGRDVFLLAAGATGDDTPQRLRQAGTVLPGRHAIHPNVPFAAMPDLYRAMDLYVHPAPQEFFGICLLEAMACGVPVVVHRAPVLEWIAGDGGWTVDMLEPDVLIDLLATPAFERERCAKGMRARQRVLEWFSWEAVGPAFIQMYREVARQEQHPPPGR